MAVYNQHVCPVHNWYSTHTNTHTHCFYDISNVSDLLIIIIIIIINVMHKCVL